MGKPVKGNVTHSKGNIQCVDWKAFIGELEKRLAFHEQRARELKPLISELKRAKSDGVPFPGANSANKQKSAAGSV
jgi:hypothetical protein